MRGCLRALLVGVPTSNISGRFAGCAAGAYAEAAVDGPRPCSTSLTGVQASLVGFGARGDDISDFQAHAVRGEKKTMMDKM